jgi:L-asparaginase II
MELNVELTPHVGKQKAKVGDKEVEFDVHFNQCYVFCNGKQVGWYCGKQNEPNKYLSFIKPLPLPIQQAIAEKVAKMTGGVATFNAPPSDEHEETE